MFQKLIRKVTTASFAAIAAKGGMACPKCGAKPDSITNDPDRLIICGSCGTKALPGDWATAARTGGVVGISDQPPAGTRIRRTSERPAVIAWDIPASGQSGSLLVIAVFWCAITAVVSGTFLFALVSHDSSLTAAELSAWVAIPFLGIFWGIGLSMLFSGLRKRFVRHRLTLSPQAITLRRELFGKAHEKSLPREGIESIAQKVVYRQNNKSVFGIEILGRKTKLRFGCDLSDEEKSWLVGSLRRRIFGPVTAAVQPASIPASGHFSVSATHLLKHNLPFAIASLLMGALFLWVVFRFWAFESILPANADPLFFQILGVAFALLGNLFHCVFILIGGSMFGAGIAMIIWVFRNHGQETRFEGSDSTVTIRRSRGGRVLSERSFARESISDILSSTSSATGGITSKRIQFVVAGKAETVATSIIADQADAMVAEMRQSLGIC